jgi:hypothetical protein
VIILFPKDWSLQKVENLVLSIQADRRAIEVSLFEKPISNNEPPVEHSTLTV